MFFAGTTVAFVKEGKTQSALDSGSYP
jgi:hypothetical protein